MSVEILFVYGLIVVAMVLFAVERVPYDLVAMMLMASLMLTGILTVKEGFSGFSNPATVTIAAMFALSKGIQNTGVLGIVIKYLNRIGRLSFSNAVLVIMVIVGFISAFINNTAAVVIFIPILMSLATRLKASPSKLLIPLSFASMFGGVCTLLGTSTNILVSSIAVDNGLEPFGMFEFAPFGLIIVVAGFTYLYVAGNRMIPARRSKDDMLSTYKTVNYLTDVVVADDYDNLGKSVEEVEEILELDIDIIMIYRNNEGVEHFRRASLQAGDVLRIRGSAHEIHKLIQKRPGLKVQPTTAWKDVDISRDEYKLLEAVIAPGSDYDGLRLKDIDFSTKFESALLGVYRRGEAVTESLEEISLGGGDSALLALPSEKIKDLRNDDNFVVVSGVEVEHHENAKIPIALGILAFVIAAAALNILPIAVSACTGVILMVVTRCLRTPQIYKAINWKVIFLLAGVIPLGVAMQKTGAAQLLSDLIVDSVGHLGPRAVLSGYFLLTTLLTAMISNQATAALLASLAIETAAGLDVDPRPFLMAITFAASLSLITPWGYQTNTLIYGPGRFRFIDYTKIGAPLNLLFWILGTIFIPIFWHF